MAVKSSQCFKKRDLVRGETPSRNEMMNNFFIGFKPERSSVISFSRGLVVCFQRNQEQPREKPTFHVQSKRVCTSLFHYLDLDLLSAFSISSEYRSLGLEIPSRNNSRLQNENALLYGSNQSSATPEDVTPSNVYMGARGLWTIHNGLCVVMFQNIEILCLITFPSKMMVLTNQRIVRHLVGSIHSTK